MMFEYRSEPPAASGSDLIFLFFDIRKMVCDNLPASVAANPDGRIAFNSLRRFAVFVCAFVINLAGFDGEIAVINAHFLFGHRERFDFIRTVFLPFQFLRFIANLSGFVSQKIFLRQNALNSSDIAAANHFGIFQTRFGYFRFHRFAVALRLQREREFHVQPLDLPPPNAAFSIENLNEFPAVELFKTRAQKLKPNFALTAENVKTVAEICRRLDGLPLAIELAAVRVRLLSPDAILERLENSLNLLTGGAKDLPVRQQTMRGAIEWSYELLDAEEKSFFRRLAIFAGGFTVEAAEFIGEEEKRRRGDRCFRAKLLFFSARFVDGFN